MPTTRHPAYLTENGVCAAVLDNPQASPLDRAGPYETHPHVRKQVGHLCIYSPDNRWLPPIGVGDDTEWIVALYEAWTNPKGPCQ